MRFKGFILSVAVLLLAGCGQQHDAESLVKDFMKQNLKEPSAISSVDFERIDSTKRLNDSIVTEIRTFASKSERYRKDIKYPQEAIEKTLIILRVGYRLNGEECSDTYYLDKNLTRVVAFKNN